jgi:phosphoribosyl 1,2-cyclic phosphodiesterase
VLNVTFHGVRGSSPCADAALARYGGNTSCVSLVADDDDPIVLDLGTGLRRLGSVLRGDPIRGTALVSHLHFDHVQGLPFFTPLLHHDTHLVVHGPQPDGFADLCAAFDAFVRPPFFPVHIDDFLGQVEFSDADAGTFEAGRSKVTAAEIPHTDRTFGYRIDTGDVTVAYLPDHQQPKDGGYEVADSALALCEGVDLLIHDAQYLPAEFAKKRDWGHCTVEYALSVARQAGAKRLALFHHDPARTDDALDALVRCARIEGERWGIEVFAAAEDQVLRLG